jgi:hypothetical protein
MYTKAFHFSPDKYIYTCGVKKAKIGPQSPKTEFGVQNQYSRVGILHGASKSMLLGVKKTKIRLQTASEPKNGI